MSTSSAPTEFRRDLLAWGELNRRTFGWRTTDDPFRILVAEILLQRSRGSTVAAVFEAMFTHWPDAASLADAQPDAIATVIRPIGLVRRATALKDLAAAIVRLGAVPVTFEELTALPGVGPYAANATLAVAFGKRAPVVDGVTARVYRRYFGLEGSGPASTDRELWELVERVTPRSQIREWNWAVLDLAALICLPKRPRCDACPLAAHCAWSRAHPTPV